MASDSRVCFAQKKEKKEIVVSRKSRQLCCLCCTSQDCFGTLDNVLAGWLFVENNILHQLFP